MLGKELELGLREEWEIGVDHDTLEAFEQILVDDGRNLTPRGKHLIQRAQQLTNSHQAADFIVRNIVREFGEVVGMNKAVSTGVEWH